MGLLESEGAICEEQGIQNSESAFGFHFLLFRVIHRDGLHGHPDQHMGEGQHQRGRHQVNQGMDGCDAHHSRGSLQEGKVQEQVQGIEDNHEGGSLDDVEIQVHQGSPLTVLSGTQGGENGGNTGTDLRADNHRDSHAPGHIDGEGERLQDTDGTGGALDNHGKYDTDHKAHDGVAEGGQELNEGFRFLEGRHGAAHHLHAEHENGEADKDGGDILLAIRLGKHQDRHAGKGKIRGKCDRFEQVQNHAVTADGVQAQEPCGEGSTEVRAEDDIDSFRKLHDAGIDETDHHDSRCGRRLDQRGDAHAEEPGCEFILGNAGEKTLQLSAGSLGETSAHDIHAVEEEGETADQAADKGQHFNRTHFFSPFLIYNSVSPNLSCPAQCWGRTDNRQLKIMNTPRRLCILYALTIITDSFRNSNWRICMI